MPSNKAFFVVFMGMSVYGCGGGGSDQPPYCFRSSSTFALAPFDTDWGGLLDVGPVVGSAEPFLEALTRGLAGLGLLRIGRSGLDFWPL